MTRPVIYCTEKEDRTKQSFRAECDMNNIVARIKKTGMVPFEAQASLRRQIFADVSGAPQSLEEAYAVVARADAAFAALPAVLRQRFGGPVGYLGFLEDPKNIKEAQDLGLVAKPKPTPTSAPNPAPVVPVANPPAGAPAPEVHAEVH